MPDIKDHYLHDSLEGLSHQKLHLAQWLLHRNESPWISWPQSNFSLSHQDRATGYCTYEHWNSTKSSMASQCMMQNLTGFASKKSSCSAKSSTWLKKVNEKMMIANKRNKNSAAWWIQIASHRFHTHLKCTMALLVEPKLNYSHIHNRQDRTVLKLEKQNSAVLIAVWVLGSWRGLWYCDKVKVSTAAFSIP